MKPLLKTRFELIRQYLSIHTKVLGHLEQVYLSLGVLENIRHIWPKMETPFILKTFIQDQIRIFNDFIQYLIVKYQDILNRCRYLSLGVLENVKLGIFCTKMDFPFILKPLFKNRFEFIKDFRQYLISYTKYQDTLNRCTCHWESLRALEIRHISQ